MGTRAAVRAAGAAGPGASAQSLIDDGLDGARASPAFGAAAKASVDLLGIARKVLRWLDRTADIVVAKHVTGTDDHENDRPISGAVPFDSKAPNRMQKEKRSFEVIPNWSRVRNWNESKEPLLRQIKMLQAFRGKHH
jgi:hypothetical protein